MIKFDGKYHAAKIDQYIHKKIAQTPPEGEFLIILVGDNPASLNYISRKTKLLQSFDIKVRFEHLSENLEDSEILSKTAASFQDPEVRGGLVQFPLPRQSLYKVSDLIPPEKDIDVISSTNIDRFVSGDFSYMSPVLRAFTYFMLVALNGDKEDVAEYIETVSATALLKQKASGLNGLILGQGDLVGKPVSHYASSLGASIRNSINYQKEEQIYSDFLVLGTGVANLVSGENINLGCNVLDFGTNVINQKVVGDLDVNSKLDHLGLVSMSPGGIGPVVTRFLLLNWLEL